MRHALLPSPRNCPTSLQVSRNQQAVQLQCQLTEHPNDTLSVTNIIRQGRCTLVATTQMFLILGLNSLITAYSLSVQYLDGIKFGDKQVTITGVLMSVCFYCISRAKVSQSGCKCLVQNRLLIDSRALTAYRDTVERETFAQYLVTLCLVLDLVAICGAHRVAGLYHCFG